MELFYDGDCPLCEKEIRVLKFLDRKSAIQFVDIAGTGFDPAQYGPSMDDFMREIHARRPDGKFVTGMEAFRGVYNLLGLGLLSRATLIPGLKQTFDAAYRLFARNRLRVTGRSNYSCRVDGKDC